VTSSFFFADKRGKGWGTREGRRDNTEKKKQNSQVKRGPLNSRKRLKKKKKT
jgi:hypothetical protein